MTGHFCNFVKSLKISGILQNYCNFNYEFDKFTEMCLLALILEQQE